MRIQPSPSLGADAAPLAEQECAAEQVWPSLYAIEAPSIAFGADAAQRGSVGDSGSWIGDGQAARLRMRPGMMSREYITNRHRLAEKTLRRGRICAVPDTL